MKQTAFVHGRIGVPEKCFSSRNLQWAGYVTTRSQQSEHCVSNLSERTRNT